jgi:hypothetical protein
MRISESRLRRIIRSVILESAMFQYKEDDYQKKDELCRDLSIIYSVLSNYKHNLDKPEEVLKILEDDKLIEAGRVSASDVKMHIKKVGDFYPTLDVSFDFLNMLGYDDGIIERAYSWGDNYLWTSYDNRIVNLRDQAEI